MWEDSKVVSSVSQGSMAFTDVKQADGTPLVAGKHMTATTNAEENDLVSRRGTDGSSGVEPDKQDQESRTTSIKVIGLNNLPNMDSTAGMTVAGNLTDSVVQISLHDAKSKEILDGTKPLRTSVKLDDLNPVFNEVLTFPVKAKPDDFVKCMVMDEDFALYGSNDDDIGEVSAQLSSFGPDPVTLELILSEEAQETRTDELAVGQLDTVSTYFAFGTLGPIVCL